MGFDPTSTATNLKSLTIGLYTPFLQGFYIGELVNQIRQLCFIKGYRLIIIRTGGYGKFNSNLDLDRIDGVVIIRNAVSPEFAEALVAANKPCVSIAYDYFPLTIPVVTSDNEFGIELAMDHLLKSGHRKIAFIGDLSQYDLRKRYEYYCDAHERLQLQLKEDYLFVVPDAQFSGGRVAAQKFLASDCDATGIIFGAGLTGMGFLQYLKKMNPVRATQISGVCFDALSLLPVFTPELASIDQNMHFLAYRSINKLEGIFAGRQVAALVLIEPKLTRAAQDSENCYDAFIATCGDLADFHNPNYMKALVANLYEWPREVAESHLDQLMSLAPLFERFMGVAFLSRYFTDNSRKTWIKQIKAFLPEHIIKADLSDSLSLCRAEKFPPPSMQEILQDRYDLNLHVPIHLGSKIWGILSIFGETATPTPASSFFAFGGYTESLVQMYERDLEIKALQRQVSDNKSTSQTAEVVPDREAVITWNFEDGVTTWSEKALHKLGFTSAMEINIYGNMEITDRLHKDDFPHIRKCVAQCKTDRSSFQAQLRYKLKNGQFHEAILAGEPILDGDQRMTAIQFYLGLANAL